jgi:threonylcarbamoyladenosine tRNA methylthiotransferase CDKAL1
MSSRDFYLLTNGCPENRIDASRMINFLKANDFNQVCNFRKADLIIFNACALTQGSEENSIKIIKHFISQKKDTARLIVCGCLPKINGKRLNEIYEDITFGSDNLEILGQIINTQKEPDQFYANILIPCIKNPTIDQVYKPSFCHEFFSRNLLLELIDNYHCKLINIIHVSRPHSFCIKVSTGCLGRCTFCAVRLSRGKVRSKSIDKIKQEFKEGLSKGHKEFALLGTDLGAYGRDLGETLVSLLRELVAEPGDYDIRLRNIQPRFLIEMLPQLIEIFQTGKISYLSTAAESGNNRILKLMNRRYKIEDFKTAVRTINENFPSMQMSTQLMVGFPSETEQEFLDTYRLLDELHFDYIEVYKFQPRPNTKAVKLPHQVPEKIAMRRKNRLLWRSIFSEPMRKMKAIRQYKGAIRNIVIQ